MFFIKSTSTKSTEFIVSISLMLMVLLFLFFFFKYYKFKNSRLKKVFDHKYISYISLILAIIIGVIFSSFNHFKPIENNPKNEWLFECITFSYGVGIYFVGITLLSLLLFLPYVILNEHKQETTKIITLKKGLILIFILSITLLIANIQWGIPYNNYSTSLSSLNFKIDYFYLGARNFYKNVFNAKWYPIFLFTYISLIIMFKYGLNKIHNKSLDILTKPYRFCDSIGFFGMFSLVSCYVIMNPLSYIIHMGVMLVSMLLIYLVINIILIVVSSIINRHQYDKTKYILNELKKIFTTNSKIEFKYWEAKRANTEVDVKLIEIGIVGFFFSLYLGFTNLFNLSGYDDKLHTGYFWVTSLMGAITSYLIIPSKSSNINLSKNLVGSFTPFVAPGLQTGIYGWTNIIFNRLNKFTHSMLIMVS